MVLSITWGAVVKIVILISIAHFIKTAISCIHDKYCTVCKK